MIADLHLDSNINGLALVLKEDAAFTLDRIEVLFQLSPMKLAEKMFVQVWMY